MKSFIIHRHHQLAFAAALACMAATTAAHADPLPIASSQGTIAFIPDIAAAFDELASGQYSPGASLVLSQGASAVSGGFMLPVGSVTVQGKGPGPIHIAFQPDAELDVVLGGVGSLSLNNFAFDVGTKNLSAYAEFQGFTQCAPGMACAAVLPAPIALGTVNLFQASTITGSIDGNMPLDQAVVLQTFAPQKILLDADLNLSFSSVVPLLQAAGLDTSQVDLGMVKQLPPVQVGTLHVSSIPEASTYAMMGLGLVGLGVLARRRAQKA